MQLKGCGKTPYSRSADGRCTLGSALREGLYSAALHALGVPTTRAVCVLASPGQRVYRDRSASPAGLVVRLAPTFVRFGTFERLAASGADAQLQRLADYTLEHFMSDVWEQRGAGGNPYQRLLQRVCTRLACFWYAYQGGLSVFRCL